MEPLLRFLLCEPEATVPEFQFGLVFDPLADKPDLGFDEVM